MNPQLTVFCSLIATFLVVSCQKSDDESRPYEFGFTIDGQQHRHEKKDVKGIIQGEFGFITADGIYHVTVYATDENGNFRILSMRNIRISAPLDGSPLPPGAKIEGQPKTGQAPTQPQPQAPHAVHREVPQNQVQPIQTTSRTKTTFSFTTQPTIKPACGGCGYVTTPKPRPGELFPFQTPAFQKPSQQTNGVPGSSNSFQKPGQQTGAFPGGSNTFQKPSQQTNGFPGGSNTFQKPSQQTGAFPGGSNTFQKPSQQTNGFPGGSNTFQKPSQQTGGSYPGSANPGQSNPNFGQGIGSLSPNPGIQNAALNYPGNSKSPNQQPGYSAPNSPYPNKKINIPSLNEIDVKVQNPLSQVSVSNGNIHVPGNPDIPIRDKYSGMVDGLPNGISEKDVTDLLYKFNYTVGFHGHYEKGLKNGAKVGGYFVTGRDGISRIVTYVADENGFRPKVKFVRLDLNSDEVPKEGTEKKFGLKNFEFVWYPVS